MLMSFQASIAKVIQGWGKPSLPLFAAGAVYKFYHIQPIVAVITTIHQRLLHVLYVPGGIFFKINFMRVRYMYSFKRK